jgi:hypothetical protein
LSVERLAEEDATWEVVANDADWETQWVAKIIILE